MKPNAISVCRNASRSLSLGSGEFRAPLPASRLAVALAFLAAIFSVSPTHAQSSAAQQIAHVPARVTQGVDNTRLTTLRGNVHPLARAEFDRGVVPDSQQADRMLLLLKRSDVQEAALLHLLDTQQDKTSPNYHAWLTPEQFGKQFAPADSDIQAVTDWLRSQGFQIGHLAAGNMFIEFTGSVGQIRKAFHTDIHRFAVDGREHFANISDPQIPSALAPVVAGVTSLHNFPRKSYARRSGVFRHAKGDSRLTSQFTFSGCGASGSANCYALGPTDFATIYNVPASVNSAPAGTGQTIAIANDSNINLSDVTAYRAFFGLPANNPNIILNGPDPGIQDLNSVSGDELEAILDVEWSGAIAPAATVDLVLSEPPLTAGAQGVDLSALYIVENNLASVMSESFGDCENNSSSSNAFYATLWEQAAAQGITAMVSSGDGGSATCDAIASATTPENAASSGLTVSGIASTSFNVAVGGTDFDDVSNPTTYWGATNNSTTLASAKSYIPETTWNDSCASTATASNLNTVCSSPSSSGIDIVGAGGGPSSVVAKPNWQTGAGVPADGKRDLPDVSLFASDGAISNNSIVICEADAVDTPGESCSTNGTAEFVTVGGTSAASPAFAAIMALVNQQTGERQGNANYALYKLAAQAGGSCNSSTLTTAQLTSNTCIFYDTTKGNNSVACVGGSTNCSNSNSGGFGVLVDPSATTTPGWTTTSGYDRATGLGSVNVGNLLTKWTSANFTSSTTTINTAPTVTVAHGTNATFKVTVAGSGGTPTGDVALIASPTAGNQVGLGPFSLSAGVANFSTNMLPGGTYQVKAHYSGDATFGGSDSAPVTITVGTETSLTSIALVTPSGVQTIVQYGSNYILRIDVTNGAGNPCSANTPATIPCPTGKVTVTDNATPLLDFDGTATVSLANEGFLEDQSVQLPVGSHSLVAAYAGDSSYAASTSAADAVTVTKASSSISLATPSPASVAVNATVTLTANISTTSSGAGPSGTVTFLNNGTSIGTANVTGTAASALNTTSPISASGVATLQTTFATAGTQSITATYTGDSTYSASGPSAAKTVTVTGGGVQKTTTTATASSTSIAAGASVTLTATVTGANNNGPGATGTVQFMEGSVALGTPQTCTPKAGTSTAPGSCTASLMTTALTMVIPPVSAPRSTPNFRATPLWIAAGLVLLAYLWLVACLPRLRRAPASQPLGYACAGLLLFACIAAGIAGCGGGSGGGTTQPTSHVDGVTAVYSGDSNYAGSTSASVSITVTTP